MRPRSALACAFTLALLFTPTAVADVEVDSPAGGAVLRTGHTENCIPTKAACLFAADDNATLEDRTFYVDTNASVDARITPQNVAPEHVPENSTPQTRVSIHSVTLEAPVLPLIVGAWNAVVPDDPVMGVIIAVTMDGVLFEGPWPAGFFDPGGPDPRVGHKSLPVPWPYLNASHVHVTPPRSGPMSTDAFWHGRTSNIACEQPYTEPMKTSSGECVTGPVPGIARSTWYAHTPNVMTGFRADGMGLDIDGNNATNASLGSFLHGATAHVSTAATHTALFGAPDAGDVPRHEPLPAPPVHAVTPSGTADWGAGASESVTSTHSSGALAPAWPLSKTAAATLAASVLALACLWLLLYRHRVRGESADVLLRNGTRRALVTRLREAPGQKVSELARAVGASHNNALYHLRILEKARVVRFVRHGGARSHVHVYPEQAAPTRDREQHALLLQADAARAIARVLVRAGERGVTVRDLLRATDFPVSTIRFHLRRFEEAALVLVTDAPRTHLLYVMPEEERAFTRTILASAHHHPQTNAGNTARASTRGSTSG